jgi:hypothetical protein
MIRNASRKGRNPPADKSDRGDNSHMIARVVWLGGLAWWFGLGSAASNAKEK